MSKYRELSILFHAWGLESGYHSTKVCKLVKSYMEQSVAKFELLSQLPPPKDYFWNLAKREIEEAESIGIYYFCILDEIYPIELLNIDDPPLVLFIMAKEGNLEALRKVRYSIVGTRKATHYGIKIAKEISAVLVNEGYCVISGLAHGIDSAAHMGTLQTFSSTIAVLGSGLLEVFPRLNIDLAQNIIDKNGLVVSEYGLRKTAQAFMFPRRNRIVTGLSVGVIVVEAELKSGSLISARLALEQGRDVFAVPGPIDVSTSTGTNKLISDGGQIITSIDSFLEIVAPNQSRTNNMKLQNQIEVIQLALSEEEKTVLSAIGNSYSAFEELVNTTNIDPGELRQIIGVLVLKDIIREVDGMYGRIGEFGIKSNMVF